MALVIKKINISPKVKMKIGDKYSEKKRKTMKIYLVILGMIGALLLSSCGEPVAYGKVDKTPYLTKECINELSRGSELRYPQIDKIVVYKKKENVYLCQW